MHRRCGWIGVSAAAVVFVCLGVAGCQDAGKKAPKMHKMEGEAKGIDLETKQVSMTVRQPDGSMKDVSAILRDDAEVLINGRVQRISDVQIGDKVVAYFQKDAANDSKYVVVKVEVTRSSDADWKSAQKAPTTQPAAASPTASTAPPAAELDPTRATASGGPTDDARVAADRHRRESETYDAIYGEIRRQMEEAIQQRKDLLAGGTDPADVQVRQLEGKIMNARRFLEERGEVVEDVDPPIVTTGTPATQPG